MNNDLRQVVRCAAFFGMVLTGIVAWNHFDTESEQFSNPSDERDLIVFMYGVTAAALAAVVVLLRPSPVQRQRQRMKPSEAIPLVFDPTSPRDLGEYFDQSREA